MKQNVSLHASFHRRLGTICRNATACTCSSFPLFISTFTCKHINSILKQTLTEKYSQYQWSGEVHLMPWKQRTDVETDTQSQRLTGLTLKPTFHIRPFCRFQILRIRMAVFGFSLATAWLWGNKCYKKWDFLGLILCRFVSILPERS